MSSPRATRYDLRASAVDYVASLLLALLITVGSLLALLTVMWLTSFFTRDGSPHELLAHSLDGRDRNPAGYQQSVDPPGTEESEALRDSNFESILELAVESASTVAVAVDLADAQTTSKKGAGDIRQPGPPGTSGDGVPIHLRWELKFLAKDIQQYAEQLDFYQIELACIGRQENVDYASQLATAPTRRSASPHEENRLQRLYFIWREDGPLKRYDEQLLNKAGIQTAGRLILRFIPKELERDLLEKESAYAEKTGHSSRDIEKTVFESRTSGRVTEFVVIQQSYRSDN